MNKKKRLEELAKLNCIVALNNIRTYLADEKLDINNVAKELRDLADYTDESLTMLDEKVEETEEITK